METLKDLLDFEKEPRKLIDIVADLNGCRISDNLSFVYNFKYYKCVINE